MKPPTLLQILGGVAFAVPVTLTHRQLVCSKCFTVKKLRQFSRSQRKSRCEPVCLECESLEKVPAAPERAPE